MPSILDNILKSLRPNISLRPSKCEEHDFELINSSPQYDYYECRSKGCAHSKGVHKTPVILDEINPRDEGNSGTTIIM